MASARPRVAGAATEISAAEARAVLLRAAGFDRSFASGADGVREALDHLGCIQLDPIDRVGTNADLVASARVDGLGRGDVHRFLAGHAFEHFAKERCLLHPRYFPLYRERPAHTHWWKQDERMARIDEALLADVLAEVRDRGPLHAGMLSDRGRVDPLDWSGWRGTSSANKLALEVLWHRCAVVVSGRDARGHHRYDVPERALGASATAPATGTFLDTMFLDRVRVCGLLTHASGPMWSTVRDALAGGTAARLVAQGTIREVTVAGSTRRYYADARLNAAPVDARPRVLGPLDPLLWDRELVQTAFGFEYLWEIYKPAMQRRWGYYVCPVLAGDRIVGRIEAHREGALLLVDRQWDVTDSSAVEAACVRLAEQNGCADGVRFPS